MEDRQAEFSITTMEKGFLMGGELQKHMVRGHRTARWISIEVWSAKYVETQNITITIAKCFPANSVTDKYMSWQK